LYLVQHFQGFQESVLRFQPVIFFKKIESEA